MRGTIATRLILLILLSFLRSGIVFSHRCARFPLNELTPQRMNRAPGSQSSELSFSGTSLARGVCCNFPLSNDLLWIRLLTLEKAPSAHQVQVTGSRLCAVRAFSQPAHEAAHRLTNTMRSFLASLSPLKPLLKKERRKWIRAIGVRID